MIRLPIVFFSLAALLAVLAGAAVITQANQAAPAPQPPSVVAGGSLWLTLASAGDLSSTPFSWPRSAGGTNDLPSRPSELTTVTVQSGDTLTGLLTGKAGLSAGEALRIVDALASVMDPENLHPGQTLAYAVSSSAETTDSPSLERLHIRRTVDTRVIASRSAEGTLDVQETSVPHQRTVESVRFRVEDGVYESAMAAGVPTQILIEAYRQLRNRVDFQRDIRLGDELSFVFEMFRHERNEIRHAGQLLAASIDQQAERIAIYRFAPGGGNSAFYNSAGVSVETVLSRTPVEGARLSSLFGERDHPILGYTRMHEGLDFAARHGTPVVAAGSGRVVRASRYGSFGKYVRIRHDPEFETAYAHLSRYANGLTAGDQVRQGQVIGYVGASGTATGPNLHYEVLRDGAPVNPRTLDLPPSQKLTGETLDEFRNHVRNLEPVLNGAAKSTYANLDAHSETPTTTGDL